MLSEINSLRPDFLIISGDVDARLKTWWAGDIDSSEGSRTDTLATSYGLHQLISQSQFLS